MTAHPVVKVVMLGLLAASVWAWAIIVEKVFAFRRARREADRFEQMFWSGQSLEELYRTLADRQTAGMGAIFVSAMREWKKSFERGARSPIGLQMRIDRAMDVTLSRESESLEARLGSLATIGSAAPFIGLFGTVVGIINAFQSIAATGSGGMAAVSGGISEALVATALGIFVAIPAVVAFNSFTGRLETFHVEINRVSSQLTNRLFTAPDLKVRDAKMSSVKSARAA